MAAIMRGCRSGQVTRPGRLLEPHRLMDDVSLQAEALGELAGQIHVIADKVAHVVGIREFGWRIGGVAGDGQFAGVHQMPAGDGG